MNISGAYSMAKDFFGFEQQDGNDRFGTAVQDTDLEELLKKRLWSDEALMGKTPLYINSMKVIPKSEDGLAYLQHLKRVFKTGRLMSKRFKGIIQGFQLRKIRIAPELQVVLDETISAQQSAEAAGRSLEYLSADFAVSFDFSDTPAVAVISAPAAGGATRGGSTPQPYSAASSTPEPFITGRQNESAVKVSVLIDEGARERSEIISTSQALIGRDANADIVLAADFVSGRHLELKAEQDGTLLIKDLSSNGTFIDGRDMNGGTRRVKPGGELVLDLGYGRVKPGSPVTPEVITRNMSTGRRRDYPRIVIRNTEAVSGRGAANSTPPPIYRYK